MRLPCCFPRTAERSTDLAPYPLPMSINRRQALHSIAAGSACGFLAPLALAHARTQPADAAPPLADFLVWKAAGKGAMVGIGSGGNSTLLLGTEVGALIDCKNAPYGECLRREATRRCKEIKLVINTHHHGDHTGGNQVFSDVVIVGHENCVREMSEYWKVPEKIKSGLLKIVKE